MIAELYNSELASWGIALQEKPAGVESVPLRVSVRVSERDALLETARRERIELGDWFNAPLHPSEAPQEAFSYVPGTCPHAENAARELVNLPTHPGVDQNAAARALDFLRAHRELLLPPAPSR